MTTTAQRRIFTPEEKASYRAWLFGSTLDWNTRILVKLNYPVQEIRWFIDAVQGLCKGKSIRIAHSTLAKRAKRFKNTSQAKALAKRAIEENNEWARLHRSMVFDIESPRPNEREGKDKRARTLYTDYLTPAAVWAQEAEHKVKKSDEVRWKKDAKYRISKQDEILSEALNMLPTFQCAGDMPEGTKKKEKKPFTLSEYVAQRESILLAENRRILGKVVEGDLIDAEEIDARLATLEVFHLRALHEIEKSYKSTRDVLLGLKATRLTRAANLGDLDKETASDSSDEAPSKGNAGIPLNTNGEPVIKGNAGIPLSVAPEEAEPAHCDDQQEAENDAQKGNAHIPPTSPEESAEDGTSPLAWALFWASQGVPVFPLHEVYDSICTCTCTAKKCATGEHGCGSECRNKGKHPRTPNGLENATTDPAQIKAWWQKWPTANIGGRTGGALRLLALDFDPKNGGNASLFDLCEAHGDAWMETLTQRTGSGGFHFFSQYPEGVELRNTSGKIAPGVDTRGEGGYVVLPPSGHASGENYAIHKLSEIAPTPQWLIEAMTRTLEQQLRVVNFQDRRERVFSSWGTIADGTRSDVLFKKVACRMRARGAEYDEILEALYEARERCEKSHEVADAILRDMAQRCVATYAPGMRISTGGAA